MTRRRLGALLVLGLVAAGCGSDSDSGRGSRPSNLERPLQDQDRRRTTTTSDDGGATTTSTNLPPLPAIRLAVPETPGGFAESQGITGGRDGAAYVITSTEDSGPGSYRDALSEGSRHVTFAPELDGQVIELESEVEATGDDITLDGSGVEITITGDVTRFSGTNIVVAGLRYADEDDDSDQDALTFREADTTQVFALYGNIFQTESDGLVDVIWNGGNEVYGTMCGNAFREHDKAVLIDSGSDDEEGGRYHITMCRNHWYDIFQRAPFSRNALVHQYNSVFERYGAPDGQGGGAKSGGDGDETSEHLLENNVAIPRERGQRAWNGSEVTDPRDEFAGPHLGNEGRVKVSGSYLVEVGGVTPTAVENDPEDVFEPPYDYSLVPANEALLRAVVATAGVCLPSGTVSVNPCAPVVLAEGGTTLDAVIEGAVERVEFRIGDRRVDGTDRGDGVWSVRLDGTPGEPVVVRAVALTADGRTVESPPAIVALVS